ncbi:MAG: glycosyltransferase family 4 protein [Ilumatobacter sp.]|nr:glycosyltransferase family 4 protein [Ilumatobacter sp.]
MSPSAPPTPSPAAAPSVAFDVGPLHGPRTGVGNAVTWTLDALRRCGDVELMPYVTSMRARLDGETRRLPMPAAVAQRWWPHWSPPLDRLLGTPDVVHGTNYVVPPTRCPRLVSVYDCWFLEHPELAAPDVRRSADVLRRAVGDGATVVASSNATAARVRDLLETDRVHTVLLGPPPQTDAVPAIESDDETGPRTETDNVTDDAPYVLAIGTIERRKNFPLLVKAFARVCAEHPSARLVIAGRRGDDSAALERALWLLDRTTVARITVVDEVDEATKQRLLAGAAALVYPSLDEGFGFPILEAAQAGVPVVATTAGSIPEIARNAALLSEPSDVDALAANIHWALTDPVMARKLVTRGTRNLARFSWEKTAAELSALYVELADGAR